MKTTPDVREIKKQLHDLLKTGFGVFLPVKQTQPVNTTAVCKAPSCRIGNKREAATCGGGQTRSDSRLDANISRNQEGRFSAAASPAHSGRGGEAFGIVSYFYSCLLIHVIPFSHNQLRI